VSREHIADFGRAAVFAADHGEPLQREGRPGTVSQQVLETLKTKIITAEATAAVSISIRIVRGTKRAMPGVVGS
jgi:hypothetical protein